MDRGDSKTRFANVVIPHLDDAYGLARWVTGSRADAEDVVQEACLRAFRGIGGFTGGNGRAWVLTIVRNAASGLSPAGVAPSANSIRSMASRSSTWTTAGERFLRSQS